ncbi:DUF2381 family protein [Pyxidicoccus xibeiensis]|uniref:DUF2381 family protein n=1 Tax=Pyxidicoccus xibeiensis TaxID=2906759 RepID=UPI0020A82B93|nr:DUF2381 family protein [Pyxidicoccus xibeiensis]MCP3136549.1 DUF2381 family protein [Pyxidicoccus xibeiensis]
MLLASSAPASELEAARIRDVLLSEHPAHATHRVQVKGQVVTTLRFEQPIDPARTKLLGWEGRFEALGVVGRKVILEPLRDLDADEGLPLLVTLADGTEVPFLLRPPRSEQARWVDQQVNVFKDRESYAAMSSALASALKENRALKDENKRFRKEETSEDHALASLLAAGALEQTPFKVASYFSGKDEEMDGFGIVYRGKGKVGVVLKLKNLDAEQPWSMKSARLTTLKSGSERSFAVRTTIPSIAPGESGVLAFVADKSAFMDGGELTSLFLEVYRHDGARQAVVQLEPQLGDK